MKLPTQDWRDYLAQCEAEQLQRFPLKSFRSPLKRAQYDMAHAYLSKKRDEVLREDLLVAFRADEITRRAFFDLFGGRRRLCFCLRREGLSDLITGWKSEHPTPFSLNYHTFTAYSLQAYKRFHKIIGERADELQGIPLILRDYGYWAGPMASRDNMTVWRWDGTSRSYSWAGLGLYFLILASLTGTFMPTSFQTWKARFASCEAAQLTHFPLRRPDSYLEEAQYKIAFDYFKANLSSDNFRAELLCVWQADDMTRTAFFDLFGDYSARPFCLRAAQWGEVWSVHLGCKPPTSTSVCCHSFTPYMSARTMAPDNTRWNTRAQACHSQLDKYPAGELFVRRVQRVWGESGGKGSKEYWRWDGKNLTCLPELTVLSRFS